MMLFENTRIVTVLARSVLPILDFLKQSLRMLQIPVAVNEGGMTMQPGYFGKCWPPTVCPYCPCWKSLMARLQHQCRRYNHKAGGLRIEP